jgi:5-formyltetrahydrofolate cyclo-ligase
VGVSKPIKMSKSELRVLARQRRVGLGAELRAVNSALICAHIESFIESVVGSRACSVVTGFVSVKSEVTIDAAMRTMLDAGIVVGLPRVLNTAEGRMDFDQLHHRGELDALEVGPHDIPQSPTRRGLDPSDIDVMFVPLIAFDNSGTRLGAGAGYFDRYLADLVSFDASAHFIGVAFGAQEFDTLPREPHDVPLHGVITESGFQSFAAPL